MREGTAAGIDKVDDTVDEFTLRDDPLFDDHDATGARRPPDDGAARLAFRLRRAFLARVASAWRLVRTHQLFLVLTLIGATIYAWNATGGTFGLAATESFSDFFDYQALSLLQGRLDVPEPAISGEAFIHDGRYYGYFGPTPAILRLPLMALGAPPGHGARLFMLGYYLMVMTGAYLLLQEACRLHNSQRPSPAATAILLANVGLGSTVFFFSSRAYVYHEALFCGLAFALLSVWCALRHWRRPEGRWWLWALMLGLLSVQARPPVGLFALGFLAVTALPRRQIGIVFLCGLALASVAGVSFLKFGTLGGMPLQMNVQYDAARLARIDGQNFHLANVPFNLRTYLFAPNLDVTGRFPFMAFSKQKVRQARRDMPTAKVDVIEPVLSIPYSMPGLTLLALIGSLAWARRRPVQMLWLAAIPMLAVMLSFIGLTHRYTGDICALLIALSAFGLATLQSARFQRLVLPILAGVTVLSIAMTLLVTEFQQGGGVWGVAPENQAHFERIRSIVDSLSP